MPIMNRFHQDEKALHQAGSGSFVLLPLSCFPFCASSVFYFQQDEKPLHQAGLWLLCFVFFVTFLFLYFPFCTLLFVFFNVYSFVLCQHLFVVINVFSRFIRCSMFIRFHQVEKALFQLDSFNIYFSTLIVSVSIDVWMFILYF